MQPGSSGIRLYLYIMKTNEYKIQFIPSTSTMDIRGGKPTKWILTTTHKRTGSIFELGYMRQEVESYSSDGGKVSNRTRTVYYFVWLVQSVRTAFGLGHVNYVPSPRWPNYPSADLRGYTDLPKKISVSVLLDQLKKLTGEIQE